MTTERELVEKAQQEIRSKYSGRYAVLLKRLGPGWYKSKLSRVLSSKNPGTVEFFAVVYAAGISLAQIAPHIKT